MKTLPSSVWTDQPARLEPPQQRADARVRQPMRGFQRFPDLFCGGRAFGRHNVQQGSLQGRQG
jgi:hypothetical protein